ncbi:MAG: ISL3 family transposase [Acidimicrobiaceae bacterium]|nr:ISL3 family transposase [Acidimicrobiaceae bacterium]
MAVDLTRALLLIVGLGPGVAVTDVRGGRGGLLAVGVELVGRPCCGGCGGKVHRHGAAKVSLADLPAFGRPTRLVWNKRRWLCPDGACSVRTFTDQDPAVAPPRARMTSRAARWATRRAGKARAISEIAAELGCGWHTAMAAVHRWGRALLGADPGRTDGVSALGLDEILMFRRGPFREKHWGTTIVDTRRGILLDIVAGRSAAGAKNWIGRRTPQWRKRIRWAVMDLSGPYRKAFGDAVPHATQIADPFHVVKLANSAIDDVRRRVQNETTGGRGTKHDHLYRTRRLLLKAAERITDRGKAKLRGLLAAGDPRGEVRDAWHAKETLRGIYRIPDRELALETLDELSRDLRDETFSPELNKLGRTLRAWRTQITNWHRSRVTNGPTEAANNRPFAFLWDEGGLRVPL